MSSNAFIILLAGLLSLTRGEALDAGEFPQHGSSPLSPSRQQIHLQITEGAGVDRTQWPVSSGVPFPKGALKDERQVALFDAEGKEVPLQTTVLSRYWEADSSIRWLLLDFQADVGARAAVEYTVKYGKGIVRRRFPSALTVDRDGDGIRINTGVVRFRVSKEFLTEVEVKTKQGWQRICSKKGEMTLKVGAPPDTSLHPVVLGKGRNEGRYSTRLDREVKVEVEDAGPVRVQVKVEGWHVREDGRRFGPFTVRVNAFSGRSYIQVYHTFVNSDLPERGLIENVGIHLPLELEGEKEITFGGEPVEKSKTGKKGESYYLLQDGWDSYKVKEGAKEKDYQGQSLGWIDVSGSNGGITAMFRNCAQLCPKEIKYENGELTIWAYPEDGVGPLDLRREEEKHSAGWEKFKAEYPSVYAQYNEGTVKAYQKALASGNLYYLMNHSALGFSRTQEIYLSFHESSTTGKELAAFAKASDQPLRAFALDHWYDNTDALGHFGWKDTVDFPHVENYFDQKIDWAIRNQNGWFPDHFWGIVNYGGMQALLATDTSSLGPPNEWTWYLGLRGWINAEVDAPKDLLLYYLRSGNYKSFLLAESVVRQMMDVVAAHANLPDFEPVSTVPDWKIGGMNRHEYNSYGGGVLENHTWNEGLINYYYLTGYKRAYDVALETGQFALRVNGHANRVKQWQLYEKQFDRNASNNWRLLLKCYELTGQQRFKEEALKWRKFYLSHSPYSYSGLQQATFMTTSYLVPTYALDYRLFGNDSVEQELINIAKWITQVMDIVEKSKRTHTVPKLPDDLKLTGEWDPYKQGFFAPALAFDITRGGGPLEDLLKTWVRERLGSYQRSSPYSVSKSDFTEMRWNEFEPLFWFLLACRDANISERDIPTTEQGLK